MKEKLDMLWQLLGCTNTDIARILGCSPSLISRIRTGSREYSPSSRSIIRLADGVYRYADSQNRIPALRDLCGAKGNDYASVISALTAWLFGMDEKNLLQPKCDSRRQKQFHFGKKLNTVMELLDLSNIQLARKISMDASVISRFRNGLRSPKQPIANLLAGVLLEHAEKQGKLEELYKLCNFPKDRSQSDYSAFSFWLYGNDDLPDVSGINSLLDSIDHFPPVKIFSATDEIKCFATDEILCSNQSIYWGIDGLREAVIRFLGTAANEGGELWLYSSQSMNWMTGDPSFHTKWSALMAACIRTGVKIRIIHNIDRGTTEILSALKSWIPLYMSGMIEPYVWQDDNHFPFSKTIFLHPGKACISASLLKNNEAEGWYEYITDAPRLNASVSDFNGLLARSTPLVKVFHNDCCSAFETDTNDQSFYILLSTLSLGTMPVRLLEEILKRNAISKEEQQKIRDAHAFHQRKMRQFMKTGKIIELLSLPSVKTLAAGKVRINLFQPFSDTELFYTPEEFADHIRAIQELNSQVNYELILLPEMPFERLQITKTESRVSVLRDEPPCTIFVLSEQHIVRAFHEYISLLANQYRSDRHSTLHKLSEFT